MSSVQEMKDALDAQREQAANIAEKALQSIDYITNNANFWLTSLSVGLAILGLVGVGVVFTVARTAATKIAKARIKSYIDSEDGKRFVRQAVEDEVRRQFEARTLLVVQPHHVDGGNGFPVDPKQQKKEGA